MAHLCPAKDGNKKMTFSQTIEKTVTYELKIVSELGISCDGVCCSG